MEILRICAIFWLILVLFERNMKRKPDAMMTVIALFVLGLIVSGFSSMSVGSDDSIAQSRKASVEYSVSRY